MGQWVSQRFIVSDLEMSTSKLCKLVYADDDDDDEGADLEQQMVTKVGRVSGEAEKAWWDKKRQKETKRETGDRSEASSFSTTTVTTLRVILFSIGKTQFFLCFYCHQCLSYQFKVTGVHRICDQI